MATDTPTASIAPDPHGSDRELAGSAGAPSVDPHVGWEAERRPLLDHCNGPATSEMDLSDVPEFHRLTELEDLIVGTPPRTVDGLLSMLRVAADIGQLHDPGVFEANHAAHRAIRTAIVALNRMVAEG